MSDPNHTNGSDATGKVENVFSGSDHLSIDQMSDYIHDNLEPKEKLIVERHLVDCELCTEAMEGLASTENIDATKGAIDEINKEIQTITGSRRERIIPIGIRQIAAAAAVIALLVGVSFYINYFFSGGHEELLADRVEKSEEEIPSDEGKNVERTGESMLPSERSKAKEEITSGPYFDSTSIAGNLGASYNWTLNENMEDDDEIEIEEDFADKDVLSKSPVQKSTSRIVMADEYSNIQQIRSGAATEMKSVAESENVRITPKEIHVPPTRQPSKKDMKKGKRATKSSREITALKKEARQNYDGKNYEESIKLYKKVLKGEVQYTEAIFYIGASYLALNKPKEAITYLERIDVSGQLWGEAAEWTKALAYIENGDNAKAKRILQDIVVRDLNYKKVAEQKLLLVH